MALLIFETLQIINQTVNSGFIFLWPSAATYYLQTAVKYFDFELLIMSGSGSVFLMLHTISTS
jgi:hypothetical protein